MVNRQDDAEASIPLHVRQRLSAAWTASSPSQAMPRASDVEKDLTHGEQFEAKSATTPAIVDTTDYHRTEPRSQAAAPKKIVIPAFISTPLRATHVSSYLTGAVIPIWMAVSISVILYNSASVPFGRLSGADACAEFIFDTLNFPFPVFLTTWHLIFSVRLTSPAENGAHKVTGMCNTSLAAYDNHGRRCERHRNDGEHCGSRTCARADSEQRDRWVRSILPIGALFSGSLILSNYAYLSLSVAFIQMLKVRFSIAPADRANQFRPSSPWRSSSYPSLSAFKNPTPG